MRERTIFRRLWALLLILGLLLPWMPKAEAKTDPGEKIIYGYSGKGRELVAWRYGTGPNVMVLGFAIHGFEDHWERDGEALVWTANQLRTSLEKSNLADLRGWSVYVLPCMNPDGLYSGYTCDGPGRCTTTYITSSGQVSGARGIDMNRCFPVGFTPQYNTRNYTGPTPLACKEAQALAAFVRKVKGNAYNVLIDLHGWYQQTITYSGAGGLLNRTISKYFKNNTYTYGAGGGYLIRYASNLGYDSCLLELPNGIYSMSAYKKSGCAEKYINVINDLLKTKPPVCDKGHHYTDTRKEPTCGKDGLLTRTCSICGHVEKVVLPATGKHAYVVTRVEPTCVDNGKETGVCSVCHADYVKPIPATGRHSFLLTVPTKPRCVENGTAISRCAVCGLKTTHALPALGHDIDPQTAETLREPTATRDGAAVAPCSRCGETVGIVLPRVFRDTKDSWYSDAVDAFYAAGLVNGTGADTFSPNRRLDRATLMTMLYRSLGCPAIWGYAPFDDVDVESWYAEPVAWGYQKGIVTGIQENEFGPKNPATREQTATMLYRVAAYLGLDMTVEEETDGFTDWDSVRAYAVDAMRWCVSRGIMQGVTETELRPRSQATRAQAVCLCSRLLELIESAKGDADCHDSEI